MLTKIMKVRNILKDSVKKFELQTFPTCGLENLPFSKSKRIIFLVNRHMDVN